METVKNAASICLDYGWRIHADEAQTGEAQGWFNGFPEAGLPAPVPGESTALGRHSVIWYENRFEAGLRPAPGQRIIMELEGTTYYTKVWLNGTFLGDHTGNITKLRLDVTKTLRQGENFLAIRMLSPGSDEVFDGLTGQQYPLGGAQRLAQPVYISLKPMVTIEDVFVRPDCKTGGLAIELTLDNAADATEVVLSASVSPTLKRMTLDSVQAKVHAPAGRSTHRLALTVEHFTYWDVDNPYLYQVDVSARAADSAFTDTESVDTGFKTFGSDEAGFFRLNEKRFYVKCAHTCPFFPGGLGAPNNLHLFYKELRYLKACGFNMVRFLTNPAHPQQLAYCDRIGLLVYEESNMAWLRHDSDRTHELFAREAEAVVRRDHNHPSLAIFGMLNETFNNNKTVKHFDAAVKTLRNVRALAPDLYVELSSGRWDCAQNIASGSNPGSMTWDAYKGDEDPAAVPGTPPSEPPIDALFPQMGDLHFYPRMPYNAQTRDIIRSMGGKRAAFLSEAGAGSQANVVSEYLLYEQNDLPLNLHEHYYLRRQFNDLHELFEAYKMDRVFSSPEALIEATQSLSARQRALLMDMIRSNPNISGYSLTMATDITYRGEGSIEGWANYKKDMTDALSDGWEDLRWCINFDRPHIYAHEPLRFILDLSNIGVLRDREYPATVRIRGPQGTVWRKDVVIRPTFDENGESPYVIPVLDETLSLHLPAGRYTVSAAMTGGAHPTCGERTFYVSDRADLPKLHGAALYQAGLAPDAVRLLEEQGASVHALDPADIPEGATVLIGETLGAQTLDSVLQSARRGAHIVGLARTAFGADAPVLPIANPGQYKEMDNWLYHYDSLVYGNAFTEGLMRDAILDPEYYECVMSKYYIEQITPPDEPTVANFYIGFDGGPGNDLWSGLQLGTYRCGSGLITVNTLRILESIGNPAADRLLCNIAACGNKDVIRA